MSWEIPCLDDNNTIANIEIVFSKRCIVDDVFPITVAFNMEKTFYQIDFDSAISLSENTPISSKSIKSLSTDSFKIE